MQMQSTKQIALPLGHELVVDNFAGGGGASVGIQLGIGRPVDVAINHDPEAVAVHKLNHPETHHYCESVFSVDPVTITRNQPVGLAWFSPDCTHHSKAKGGKPRCAKRRGLAWIVIRWARRVRPRVIMLENVEEFAQWGPLQADGTPCPARRGQTFRHWWNQLERCGYRIEMRELRACDYGAPTIRKRLFIIARRDGLPIRWPEPTHGPGLLPYRTAAECIDWSIPCPSIFERKKPLAEATCRRVAEGIRRFVVETEKPYFVTGIDHKSSGISAVWSAEKPLTTITTENRHALVTAFLAKHYTGVVGTDVRQPIGTVTAVDHHSLVTSHLVKLRNNGIGQDVRQPLHTITASGTHHAEVRAFLIKYYSEGGQWASLHDPMHTIPTKDRLGLVLVRGEPYQIVDIGLRMLQPHELSQAQGFPDWYRLDGELNGRKLGKTVQVRMIGNSVSPVLAEALVRINFQHEKIQQRKAA